MLRKIMNLAAGAVFAISTIGFASAESPSLTPAQMREDLLFLKQQWIDMDHSFSDQQRLAFHAHVDDLLAGADRLSPQMFSMEVARGAALARNGHSNANISAFVGPDLPIRVWLFADGLHVVKAHPDFAHLLGARIDGIGSLPTAVVLERLKPFLSGTDQRIRFLSPGYLVAPSVLKHIGAVDNADPVSLKLQLADGRSETIELQPSKDNDPGDERTAGINRGYAVLTPDDVDLPERWHHVLDGQSSLSPVYGKRGDVQAQFLDPAEKVLYIRNDTGKSLDETPLSDKFAGVVLSQLLPARPRDVIVDLRFHNGGDLFNAILFAKALPRLVPAEGRVFVLVSRATYSAGISTAAMLKGADPEKVKLVGETMGDSARFWGEGKSVKLPNSQIPVRYATEFHDYETGCFDLEGCYWPIVAFGPRGISISPDKAIDPSFADYAAGRDPVLEWVLGEIAKK